MPNYIVTAPDGRKFRITAPEGATQEQVLSYAQGNAAAAAPSPTHLQQIETALRRADAAGNVEDALRLAQAYAETRDAQAQSGPWEKYQRPQAAQQPPTMQLERPWESDPIIAHPSAPPSPIDTSQVVWDDAPKGGIDVSKVQWDDLSQAEASPLPPLPPGFELEPQSEQGPWTKYQQQGQQAPLPASRGKNPWDDDPIIQEASPRSPMGYTANELFGKLERADAAGDIEAARVIADEIRQLPGYAKPSQTSPSTKYQQQAPQPAIAADPTFDPNAGMSWSDKLFVGMGRGAAGVYQGAKQIGLQAGERLGVVDPGTADAYTKKIQAEHALYDRYSPGLGAAGKIGEFAGSAMAVPIPGVGANAGLLGRLGGAAAMGAGQGALEFVPEGESRANNALVGGLAGLAGQTLIGEPLRGGLRRLASLAAGGTPNITGNAANALAYANERNLPLYYDDIAGSRGARALGTFTDDLPLLGTGRTRKAQSEAVGAAAQSIADRFQQQAPGRVADSLKESAERQLARARGLKNELYRSAFQQLNALGEFDLPKTRAMAKRIIEHNQKKGTLADPTVIAELQRYADAPTFNFEGWHGARSELGGTIRRQMSGENAILSDASTAQLRTLKGIMDAELRATASKAGDSAATAWRRADNFYRTAMPKYKRGVVADLLKSKNPDAIADKILDGKDSEGIARQVYQALDRGGRADVRSALLSRAMERATVVNPDGGEYFSPAVFAKELGRVQSRTAAFFKREDRLEIEGLQNYMQFVKQAGSYAANPPTGKRLLPHLALLAGSGAIGGKALAAYGSVAATSRLLLRTQLGRNMLLRMGSVSPTSKAAAETAQAINAYLQRALASQATDDGLNIDIVGGTPGPAPTEAELQRLRAGR